MHNLFSIQIQIQTNPKLLHETLGEVVHSRLIQTASFRDNQTTIRVVVLQMSLADLAKEAVISIRIVGTICIVSRIPVAWELMDHVAQHLEEDQVC